MKKYLKGVAITAMLGLLAANCFAATSGPSLQEIEKAAKAEGELVWQVLGSADVWQPVADVFRAKYPGIKVSLFVFNSDLVPTRIITEARAKKFGFDVASTNTEWMLPLLERDLLVRYDPGKIVNVMPNTILLDGLFHNYGDNPLVWVYNKNLVSKNDAPRSWEDLLDPKWKGYAISIRALAQQLAGLFPEWRENPKKVVQYLDRLDKQQIMWAGGNLEGYKRVTDGECKIGVFRYNGYSTMKRDGAPIELAPISPVPSTPAGAILVKDVPHPNAARLLITWLHSPEGRAALTLADWGWADPCDASPMARTLCENGIKHARVSVTAEDTKKYYDFMKEATDALRLSVQKK